MAASVALRMASGTSRALPWPKPTRPLLVADDHERGEAEAPAALHHLGDAVDVDELVDELAVAIRRDRSRRSRPRAVRSRAIVIVPQNSDRRFAGGVGERLDAPMIDDSRRGRTRRCLTPFSIARSAIELADRRCAASTL